jgi:hypothetical protein
VLGEEEGRAGDEEDACEGDEAGGCFFYGEWFL